MKALEGIVVIAMVAGCSSVDISSTRFSCDLSNPCPSGLICCTNGFCTGSCGGQDGNTDGGTDQVIWYDEVTGLSWWLDIPKEKMNFYPDASSYCSKISSSWKVATVSQLRSVIRGCPKTESFGECPVVDQCPSNKLSNPECADSEKCLTTGCQVGEGPNNGCYLAAELSGPCGDYWSYSMIMDDTSNYYLWYVDFKDGSIRTSPYQISGSSTDVHYVLCVKVGKY